MALMGSIHSIRSEEVPKEKYQHLFSKYSCVYLQFPFNEFLSRSNRVNVYYKHSQMHIAS